MESIPVVEPIESVETVPEVIQEPVEVNGNEVDDTKCWNCKNPLNPKHICDKCGFDRNIVSNLRLEAKIKEGKA